MSKFPHMPLYTGDWLKDPDLSFCTPATRGVWIDLLCAMHERGRSGELRGTPDQLARLARCSTVELEAALTDLQTTNAAIVENRNGSWTVANRRMRKEHALRLKRQESGSLGGSKTQAIREQSPDTDNEGEGLERVKTFAKEIGVNMADAEWFYWKGVASGWTNGGQPIRDWKATLRSWSRAGYLPSQKRGATAQFSRQANGSGPFEPKRSIPDDFRDWLILKYPDHQALIRSWKTWEQIPTGLRDGYATFKGEQKTGGKAA